MESGTNRHELRSYNKVLWLATQVRFGLGVLVLKKFCLEDSLGSPSTVDTKYAGNCPQHLRSLQT